MLGEGPSKTKFMIRAFQLLPGTLTNDDSGHKSRFFCGAIYISLKVDGALWAGAPLPCLHAFGRTSPSTRAGLWTFSMGDYRPISGRGIPRGGCDARLGTCLLQGNLVLFGRWLPFVRFMPSFVFSLRGLDGFWLTINGSGNDGREAARLLPPWALLGSLGVFFSIGRPIAYEFAAPNLVTPVFLRNFGQTMLIYVIAG